MGSLDQYIDWQRSERRLAIERAERALVEARREIDHIEQQLAKAVADEAYLRIERVDGVQAKAIFDAFGLIERVALLEKMAAES